MQFKFTFILLFSCIIHLIGQKGLEGIIVEKYYISNAQDAANTDGGKLKEGSTTYRIYVDMLPGYKFQAAYGDVNHELKISTTTKFFNNEDRGDVFPTFNKNALKSNTVMLDSWLSTGAACVGNLGVLKSKDDGLNTVINSDGILKNNDPNMGITLEEQDGMVLGKVQPAQSAGFDGIADFFNNTNEFPDGVSFSSNSGAWFTPSGAVGADSTENMVLIAQLTTDGILSFELNFQLGTPVAGITENYVAKDPKDKEIFDPSLIYTSNITNAQDQFNSLSFKTYPNPTTSKVYFKLSDKENYTHYEVQDLNGRIMKTGKLDKQSQELDLYELNDGVYLLSFFGKTHRGHSKIVKI